MAVHYQYANAQKTAVYTYDQHFMETPWNPVLDCPLDRWGQAYRTWVSFGSPQPSPYVPPQGAQS